MYTDFYGLNEVPFSLTPDSRFLFFSAAHKEALGHLLYGIRERKGFILITGEIGTGKTTLCRALLNELGPDTASAFIMNTFLTETELLMNIVYDLTAESGGRTKKELIDYLNGFLLRSKSEGRNVVILIDECQNLSPEVMEQIRMLSNLETERDKLLQIVLVGQPEVRDILAMPRMSQLDQRIAVRYHLRPLTRKETGEYISHRLSVAGLRGGLDFRPRALDDIFRFSGGTPRLINILCDRILLIGYVDNARRIGRGIVRRARAELDGMSRRRERVPFLSMRISPMRIARVTLVAAVVFAGLLGWANRESPQVGGGRVEPVVVAGSAGAVRDGLEMAAPLETVLSGVKRPGSGGQEETASSEAAEAASSVEKDEAGGDGEGTAPLPPEILAAEHLLRLWGYDVNPSRTDSLEGLVRRSGFRTVGTWAELPFILRVNLPCVMEVGGGYYVLEGIDGAAAVCWSGDEEVSIPLGELARLWDGRAFIVNRHVSSYDPLLHRTMRGSDVLETQEGLGKLKYYSGGKTGCFDKATEKAVRKLQMHFGLNADGIVGPETRLAMWSMLAGAKTPRLSR